MSLSTTFDTIAAAMTVAFPALQSGLGQRALDAVGAPPRMVWVPSRDAYGAPVRDRALQRSIRSCATTCAVYLWGASVGDVEDLRERLLTVLQATAPGAWDATAGEWSTPGNLTAGEQLAMLVTLQFSQHELPAPTIVTLTAAEPDTTGAADPDGSLQVGETP